MVTKLYKDIPCGRNFHYKKLSFTKLDDETAIINSLNFDYSNCYFDNINNEYDKSLIRYYINGKFLKFMGIDKEDLLPLYKSDLATLLTEQQYVKNKLFIKKWDCQWWLRDADLGRDIYTLVVNVFGGTWVNYVRYDGAVRVVVKFKPTTAVCK
jgi:hypothetical protein